MWHNKALGSERSAHTHTHTHHAKTFGNRPPVMRSSIPCTLHYIPLGRKSVELHFACSNTAAGLLWRKTGFQKGFIGFQVVGYGERDGNCLLLNVRKLKQLIDYPIQWLEFRHFDALLSFSQAKLANYPIQKVILWMDEILHHLRNAGIGIPLEIPTNNGLPWFQSRAGFRPSTVAACLASF